MKKIFGLLLMVFAWVFAGCEREFDEPLLQEPVYDGEANMTIKEFREMYNGKAPKEIDTDYVIRGIITGNDVTGNIYKAIYIEDETGGLSISVDANSMYATHRVGQEVFIDLHGLAAVEYGGALQLGYNDPDNSNRISWEMMREHEHFNGYPDASKVKPRSLTIEQLKALPVDEILHTLVRLDNVYFQNGGKNPFSSTTSSTNETIIDASDPTKTIIMRTSQYSSFVSDILPAGTGTVVGVLGRFGSDWQLVIRSLDDVFNFPDDPVDPVDPEPGDEVVIFSETFGTGNWPSGNRPKIADFTDFDETGVTYSDVSGNTDIRSTGSANAHAWFPNTGDAYLTISGINTDGYDDLSLSFDIAANMYGVTDPHDLATMFEVKWNGTSLSLPSEMVTADVYRTFKITTGITSSSNVTLEFHSTNAMNTLGLRIDNIKITAGGGDGGDPGPGPGTGTRFFYETFGDGNYPSGNRPKIGAFTDFDVKNVTYSDASGNTDIRSTGTVNAHAWFPNTGDGYLTISGIDTSPYTTVTLSFDAAANMYDITGENELANMFTVSCNGTVLPTTKKTLINNDQSFYTLKATGAIDIGDNVVIEFHASQAANPYGLRIDNIALYGE